MFASIELSKKLGKMGCKTSMRFVWSEYDTPVYLDDPTCTTLKTYIGVHAFEPWDFIANTEQADMNVLALPEMNRATLPFPTTKKTADAYAKLIIQEWKCKAIDAPDFWEFVEQSLGSN